MSSVLVDAAERLANEAARAVTEPKRFHENEDGRQQALSRALAEVRLILREDFDPVSRDVADLLAGLEVSSIRELAELVELARMTLDAINRETVVAGGGQSHVEGAKIIVDPNPPRRG